MISIVRRNTDFRKYGIYHVFSRGNRREKIFLTSKDCMRFELKLKYYSCLCTIEPLVYCLMRNHFHLILRQHEDTSVSALMQRVNLSHAKYFNTRYRKIGHVFQGRFGAREICDRIDEINTVKYICENPVKEGYVNKWSDYRWLWFDDTRYHTLGDLRTMSLL